MDAKEVRVADPPPPATVADEPPTPLPETPTEVPPEEPTEEPEEPEDSPPEEPDDTGTAPAGPCDTHSFGDWCDGADLVTCLGGAEVARVTCEVGCEEDPLDSDVCAVPGPCYDLANGWWCHGEERMRCFDGDIAEIEECAHGCDPQPPGLHDVCAEPVPVDPCDGLATGWWCHGAGRMYCDGGLQTTVEDCPHGCDPQPPGFHDVCAEAPVVTGPAQNPYGIGLVGPGDAFQWDKTAELVGYGGHIKLIFPGVEPNMTTPPPEWVAAVQGAYDRDLVPVIRMGPHWGQMGIRNWSDPGDTTAYTQYAAAYRAVVEGLPRRTDWPLWIEIHNEPNLCYEWTCDAGAFGGAWMGYETLATEYAGFMVDVADALHAIGDPRIQVMNGGLAPGGVVSCECGGTGFNPGITSLEFLDAMLIAEPDFVSRLDGFATHSYPMSHAGWGFFEDYSSSHLGLTWWEQETARIGATHLPVFVTETGWTTDAGAHGSRQQVADWTVLAYQNEWTDPRIRSVMPFMLLDPAWDAFSWVDHASGQNRPVFDAVRTHRCATGVGGPC